MHNAHYQSDNGCRTAASRQGDPQVLHTDAIRELRSGLHEIGHAICHARERWGLDGAVVRLIDAHESLWEMVEAAETR